MQDLSASHEMPLAPGSMSGGNTVDLDSYKVAFTAPGSQSVNPLPDKTDYGPLPVIPGEQIPVNYPVQSWEVPPPADAGFGPAWQDSDESGEGWKQL
jgi:hypothetical protein